MIFLFILADGIIETFLIIYLIHRSLILSLEAVIC
jgi:hypothetical protein